MAVSTCIADLISAKRRLTGDMPTDDQICEAVGGVRWMPEFVSSDAPYQEVFSVISEIAKLHARASEYLPDEHLRVFHRRYCIPGECDHLES